MGDNDVREIYALYLVLDRNPDVCCRSRFAALLGRSLVAPLAEGWRFGCSVFCCRA